MLETVAVAAAIMLLLDLSIWRYGRDLMRLNKEPQPDLTYGTFFAKRIPIIIAVFGSFALVMMDSHKSIYLRVALLIVMLIGYIVVSLKDLKG